MNTVADNWSHILETFKSEYDISDLKFNTFIKPLVLYKVEGETVTLLISSSLGSLGSSYFDKNFKRYMELTINMITGMENCQIVLLSEEDADQSELHSVEKDHSNDARIEEAGLNPRYTFDTFVVGGNNQFAQAAALAVAESPAVAYNPLFIYGGAGFGKTHLMHSIGHYIIEHDPNSKVLYVTSEDFTNELIDSILLGNNASMSKFRDKYRNIDVLMVDDIQFIIGKDSTQEEFFHTFNSLYNAKKQIIITSDKPPKDLEILDERFRSRFEWGLIADIKMPDYETRMAILRKKEEMDGYNIDNEIIHYIATNIKSNIRELEGALNKVIAYSRLQQQEITMDLAIKALRDIISPDEKKVVTPEEIIKTVADYYHLSSEDIVGIKRNSKIVLPRQITMYLCREITATPLKSIGNYLGKRDHTTIMHGIEKIEKEKDNDPSIQNDIDVLTKRLTS